MLVLTRRADESIMVGHDVRITVLGVRDGVVKLGISAPPHVQVHRDEVYVARQEAEAAG